MTTPQVKPGLVSTIIPVFNRAAMVERAVASVLGQDYRPIEIILVNDGSTDHSAQVLDALEARHVGVIRAIHQRNAGPGSARETGRLAAQGEFIQYLDSDDWLLPGKFSLQVDALRRNGSCGIAYCASRFVNDQGQVLEEPSKWTGRRFDRLFPALLVERWWHTHTPLYRREVSDAMGAWPDRRPEDWEMDARAGALGVRLAYCPEVLSCQLAHEAPGRVSEGPKEAYYRDEAWFLPRLHGYGIQAGVAPDAAEMRHLSRWAFALARRLAEMGEDRLASGLLDLAVSSTPGWHWDAKLMRLLSRLMGWRMAGHLLEGVRRRIRRGPGRNTLPGW